MYHENGKRPIFHNTLSKKWNAKQAFYLITIQKFIRPNPTFSEGLDFIYILENLEQLVNELKDEKGVDILFLVTHIGIISNLIWPITRLRQN